MNHHYVVAEQFFDQAEDCVHAFESHFSNPQSDMGRRNKSGINWYVPGLYTYLKTRPPPTLSRGNSSIASGIALNQWAISQFGLSTQLNPWLSLYVDGCGQGLHNDAAAGQMGFVYSITRWDNAIFSAAKRFFSIPRITGQTERIKSSGARVFVLRVGALEVQPIADLRRPCDSRRATAARHHGSAAAASCCTA